MAEGVEDSQWPDSDSSDTLLAGGQNEKANKADELEFDGGDAD